MTSKEFEQAQLKWDLTELETRYADRLVVAEETDSEEFRRGLQAYFERRD